MAQDTTFQLDITAAGQIILQTMAADIVRQSATAIMGRAGNMAASQYSKAPGYKLNTKVGVIRTGKRAIATVTANDADDAHGAYIARLALLKARDAGRV